MIEITDITSFVGTDENGIKIGYDRLDSFKLLAILNHQEDEIRMLKEEVYGNHNKLKAFNPEWKGCDCEICKSLTPEHE